ncbi:Nucleoside ABC transporter, permease protein 1 [Clostridiaceae bacterium JG1575]|nr:Nucleoside ABC transporter, permease protein 1 [Clostridiaceae bacterium JG1575]
MANKDQSRNLERFLPLVTPLVSLALALLISLFIVYYTIPNLTFGATTKLFFKSLFDANFKDTRAVSDFLVNTTPLIFTGLAHCLAFRSGLFNIGVEGQFTVAAITAAAIGLIPGLPFFIHIPLVILGAVAAGALWAFIPGFFKATRGTNEVVNTIMMNYIAMHLYNYIIRHPLHIPNTVATKTIEPSAFLWRFLGDRYRVNFGLFLALGIGILVWYFLTKTKLGYELRATGLNMYAAEYGGINRKKGIIVAMVLSGALAGMAGAVQIMGPEHSAKELAAFAGFGFNGIAVALLAKSNPLGVLFSAMLFGALINAGPYMQIMGISKDLGYIIQALVILFVAADYVWKILLDKKKKMEVKKHE